MTGHPPLPACSVAIGTAMIVFQTINLFLPYIMIIVFKLLPLLWRLGCMATARALRRVRPTARFVEAVRAVMRQVKGGRVCRGKHKGPVHLRAELGSSTTGV